MAEQKKTERILNLLFFVLYLILLFYFLLFAEMMGRHAENRQYSYNLVLFHEIKRFIIYRKQLGFKAVFLNIPGNIIGFVPFGYLLPEIFKKIRNGWTVFGVTLATSFLVEVLQLITRSGSFDVDDILLNVLGGIIGYFFFYLKRKKKPDKIKLNNKKR